MLEDLVGLLGSDRFMPHGHCWQWTPALLWSEVVANGAISLAYLVIGTTLGRLVRDIEDLPFRAMYLAFGVFIFACGVTHALDVWVVWQPVYWLDVAIRGVTAGVSVATAAVVPSLVPKAKTLARGMIAVRDRGVELERAMEDLGALYERTRELDDLKTQFFANVSHELRTPIALVLGPVEQMLASGRLDPMQRWELEVVARNARSILRHVEDLLDLARLEAGESHVRYESADVAALTRRVASNFDGVAAERRIAFVVDAPDTLEAEVDSGKLERVVLNLLSNAFKFTPTGGRVHVDLSRREGEVLLVVDDSGPGVHPDQRELIFERFRQGDGGRSRQHGGTGLGLSIARDFVRQHGGGIAVGEAPEGGASFRVVVPERAPAGAEVAARARDPEGPDVRAIAAREDLESQIRRVGSNDTGTRPRVLVVEDNVDMLAYLASVLSESYDVVTASGGEEGMEAIFSGPTLDLVLVDIMMPRVSGDQLIEAVRRREAYDGLPIVVLSAKADEAMRLKLLDGGAQDWLTKPCSPTELLARVANLVTMKRARDVLQAELEVRVSDLESLSREVTNRKRELEVAVEAMRVAREHAARAGRVRTDFLHLVSHELRTPLTTIRLQLERLLLEASQEFDERQRGTIGRIAQSFDHLVQLLDALITFTEVQTGALELHFELVDVGALVAEAAEHVRTRAEQKGLALVVEVPPGVPPWLSDRRLLRIVVLNVLDNAVKFTGSGTVAVTVAATSDGDVEIRVVDTGPGIPPELLAEVFEPFVHGERVRQKHSPGLGLGLALVRLIVDRLGGTIQLRSREGVGTTVTIVLRRPTAEEAPS